MSHSVIPFRAAALAATVALAGLLPQASQADVGLSMTIAGADYPTIGTSITGQAVALPSLDFRGERVILRLHLLDILRGTDRIDRDWFGGLDLFFDVSTEQEDEPITFIVQPGFMAMGGQGLEG